MLRKFGRISQYPTIFQFTSMEWQIMEREGIEKNLFPTIREQEGNKKNIPRLRKREGNGKKTFSKFGNGKGMKKSIPIIREWESEAFIPGNGREREFPLAPV